ncbi:Rrf2 family transcriptional regulator [Alicyclobacillus dauci]|uniref:HTH-type transcriptional regulator NsrR n=1 Tax=Alicyclobacillus dauci TaxID=1475485 RepID=A0ABY6Z5M1_9BACL|nr:Rrf2 family transcriptional regulator [Alicyclobacillus dauci]WAH38160.1 Rrf2 family transcriptional regulator [Alicyclobacillus dauci]
MNLTRFTDYSLRVLLYVAVQPEDRLSNIQEISKIYHISNNHLMKTVHRLGQMGLVHTVRGRNGGFRLAKNPEEINIGWVVRQTEENWDVVECFDETNGFCVINPACRLKRVLAEALDAFFSVLDGYTLADLIVNRSSLQDLLLTTSPEVE